MDEVFAVADRVSVLRDGHLVVTQPTLGLDTSALIELILGRKLGDLYPSLSTEIAGAVLEVDGLTGSIAHDITLSVRRGEILGLTGVTGDAHEEVPYLLYGAQSSRHGTVRLHGSPINPLTPVHCKRAGIGFLPANRQREGGIGRATVGENVTLPDLKSFRVPWGLNHAAERAAIRQALEDFDVRPADPGRLFGNLSGGNQQKVLLARWIRMNPEVLVLHEPTQGVDVGARAGIFRFLREAASRGMSIVYASTEYEDLAHVCNRVLVLRRGRVTAEFGGATLTSEAILRELYRREGEPSRTVRAENPSDQVTPRGGTHE
jgi:ribose transport system ATP-binding protein